MFGLVGNALFCCVPTPNISCPVTLAWPPADNAGRRMMVPLLLVEKAATGFMTCLASGTRVLAHEFVDGQ